MVILKTKRDKNYVEKMWQKGNSYTLLVGLQSGPTILGKVWQFLKNVNINLLYYSETLLMGIQREMTTEVHTCIRMFKAPLLTAARNWK